MGFIDWIKGAGSWIHNNIIKPVLGGASWLKKTFLGPVLDVASFIPGIGGIASAANTALTVMDTANDLINPQPAGSPDGSSGDAGQANQQNAQNQPGNQPGQAQAQQAANRPRLPPTMAGRFRGRYVIL